MTTLTLSHRVAARKLHMPSLLSLPWKLLAITGMILVSCLLIFYVLRVDQLTKGAYLLKTYQKQIDALSGQNGDLEKSFAESGFLGNVAQRAQAMGFEKTGSVTYVKVQGQSLAAATGTIK